MEGYILATFYFLLICEVKMEIRELGIISFAYPDQVIDIDATKTHSVLSFHDQANSRYYMGITKYSSTAYALQTTLQNQSFVHSNNIFFRTSPNNIIGSNQSHFLIFSIDFCKISNYDLTNTHAFYTVTQNQQIYQCRFAINQSLALLVVKNLINSIYQLICVELSSGIQLNRVQIGKDFDQGKIIQKKFHVVYYFGHKIFSPDASLTLIKQFSFPRADYRKSFTEKFNYFAWIQYDTFHLFNVTDNYSLIRSVSFYQSIVSFHFYSKNLIIMITQLAMFSYDLDLQMKVTNIDQSILQIHIVTIQNGNYIYCNQYALSKNNLLVVQINPYYSCPNGCSTCYPTYSLNLTSLNCDKITYNLTNSTTANTTNSSINNTFTNNYEGNSTQASIQSKEQNQILSLKLLSIFGHGMKISSLKFISKYVIFYILYLDDLEYYQYHRTNFSQFMIQIISHVNYINDLRFGSIFVSVVDNMQIKTLLQEDQLYKPMIIQYEKDPSYFYFLASSSNIFFGNMLGSLFFYLIFKIFHIILYILHEEIKMLNKPYKWVEQNTKWWTIPSLLLQNNIISLTFNVFVQLQPSIVGWFRFDNKINFTIMIFVLFLLVMYSIGFYWLVYAFKKRRNVSILMIYCKSNFQGYFLQSVSRMFRNALRGFLHGFFIQNYRIQAFGLAISNLIYLPCQVLLCKHFINFGMGITVMSYYCVFSIFDWVLALRYIDLIIVSSKNFNLLITILIGCLIALVFLNCLVFFCIFFVKKVKQLIIFALEKSRRLGIQSQTSQYTDKNLREKKKKITIIFEQKQHQKYSYTETQDKFIKVQELSTHKGLNKSNKKESKNNRKRKQIASDNKQKLIQIRSQKKGENQSQIEEVFITFKQKK